FDCHAISSRTSKSMHVDLATSLSSNGLGSALAIHRHRLGSRSWLRCIQRALGCPPKYPGASSLVARFMTPGPVSIRAPALNDPVCWTRGGTTVGADVSIVAS